MNNNIGLIKVKTLSSLVSNNFPEGTVIFCEDTKDIYIKSNGELYEYTSITYSVKEDIINKFSHILNDLGYDYSNDSEILNILNDKITNNISDLYDNNDILKLLYKCIDIIKDLAPEKSEYIDKLYKSYNEYGKYIS